MDWLTWKQNGIASLQKYKYVFLVVLVGIFLMVLPEQKEAKQPAQQPQPVKTDLQQSLTQLLSRVDGAGKVEVLLTEALGAETVYQTDEDLSKRENAEDIRRDTVRITTASREEAGLVKQVIPPKYLGAVILCQGAEDAYVRLSIVEAVMSATGLRSDKITVLKMK